MIIDDVNRGIQKGRNRKRIGRGIGSGHGKTSGSGHKGQGQRAGNSSPAVFVGGNSPLVRRVPKRGFNNRWGLTVVVVNIGQIDAAFAAGEPVTAEALKVKNLAKGNYDVLKVLGDGELTKALTIEAHRFSKTAEEKIAKAGGKAVVLPGKVTVAEKKAAAAAAAKS